MSSFPAKALGFFAFLLSALPAWAEPLYVLTSFPDTMTAPFANAFARRHPDSQVVILNRKTSAAISYIRENTQPGADVLWASAPDAFEILKAEGLLKPVPDLAKEKGRAVAGYPVDDPDGRYLGFALSGYGLMWNTEYLDRHGLPAPALWSDLKNPRYRHHVGITAPSRSGTTHLIVEAILQKEGWDAGWAALLEIGGNMATVTARSYGVMEGVKQGRFGIGPVIDFFGLSSKAMGAPVEFAYPESTVILPASVGIAESARNERDARRFIAFLLSGEGQRLLLDPQIRRLPVATEAYAEAPEDFPNPYRDRLARDTLDFDTPLSQLRYNMVNSLFDHLITFRLRTLGRAWQALQDAEAMPERTGAATRSLAEARALLGKVPVSAEQARDPEFNAKFSSHHRSIALPAEQVAIERAWIHLGEIIDYRIAVGGTEVRVQRPRRDPGLAVDEPCGLLCASPRWYPDAA